MTNSPTDQLNDGTICADPGVSQLNPLAVADVVTGVVVAAIGLVMWSPLVSGMNWIGLLLTLVGLYALARYVKTDGPSESQS